MVEIGNYRRYFLFYLYKLEKQAHIVYFDFNFHAAEKVLKF